MTEKDIAKELADRIGVSVEEAENAVMLFFDTLAIKLVEGKHVIVKDFFSISPRGDGRAIGKFRKKLWGKPTRIYKIRKVVGEWKPKEYLES